MKNLSILIFGLFLSTNLQSQSYIPLQIDSSFYWSWVVDFHGDTLITENPSGFSYDSNDSLIQKRYPNNRFTYSYAPDSVIFISETKDTSNNWNFFSRRTSVYEDGKIKSYITEKYENNAFEISAMHTYHYDEAGRDTLNISHSWNNGMWNETYKIVKTYDANGNKIEESEYDIVFGVYEFEKGKLYDYDNANHLIEEIDIKLAINGPHYSSKLNWVYGNDDLLDTLRRCSYSYPDYDVCHNKFLTTYDYSGQDTIVEKWFDWSNNNWVYLAKHLNFAGPEIYSNKPDSIISYGYNPDSLSHFKYKRQYFQYEDLGNDSIYFRQEEYNYLNSIDDWNLKKKKKKWYHLKMLVNVDNINSPNEFLSIYPNPCKVGQQLNINNDLSRKEDVEIFIFDLQGKLISRNVLRNQNNIQAPNQEGIYTIIIREKDRLVGVSKQVVID
ncbi:MAG: T9SS type A sorting domain-containing protein [Saprospiraceae bacterium]